MYQVLAEEPYDGRLSSTVLWEAWGEIPLAYSTKEKKYIADR